ncbi:MAG: LNS2 domain-containing protein [Oligoflexus sp.]
MRRKALVYLGAIWLSGCGYDNPNSGLLSQQADQSVLCPSYLEDQDLPLVSQFTRGQFKHARNKLMALTLKKAPYHFAKDLILSAGQSGTMEAKFDYGSIFHKDLEDELVEAYLYNADTASWEFLKGLVTDWDGKVYLPVNDMAVGEYAVKFIVKGDGSTASGRITVTHPETPTVIFDLDSTLTTNDLEAINDYLNIKNAKLRPAAVQLVKTYETIGYRIVYLTSRPYILIPSTQKWLEDVGLPRGHLYSPIYFEDSIDVGNHAKFKADYIHYLQSEVGLKISAAYGNSKSDIEAYESAGIMKSVTYITGKLAGSQGTVAVADYQKHIPSIYDQFPSAACKILQAAL